jgi:hypothetical protein
MSYNLHTRVDKLERRAPSPLEQMTEEELQARLNKIHDRLDQSLGLNSRMLEVSELKMLIQAELQGEEATKSLLDQLRQKYGPPLHGGSS